MVNQLQILPSTSPSNKTLLYDALIFDIPSSNYILSKKTYFIHLLNQ